MPPQREHEDEEFEVPSQGGELHKFGEPDGGVEEEVRGEEEGGYGGSDEGDCDDMWLVSLWGR